MAKKPILAPPKDDRRGDKVSAPLRPDAQVNNAEPPKDPAKVKAASVSPCDYTPRDDMKIRKAREAQQAKNDEKLEEARLVRAEKRKLVREAERKEALKAEEAMKAKLQKAREKAKSR